VSVDLEATLRKPITLAAMREQARTILSDLLGAATVPDLAIFADRQYRQGVRTDPGRCLDAAELTATAIGGPIAPDETGVSASIDFEIDVPATGALYSAPVGRVGVTVAIGLTLAVAQLADGDYLDEQIRMLRPEVREPMQVISRTRLPEDASEFTTQCEKYLRQFPSLNGWPRDCSMS
jgi:hypothetical protein